MRELPGDDQRRQLRASVILGFRMRERIWDARVLLQSAQRNQGIAGFIVCRARAL
jgi:hypothetical protein